MKKNANGERKTVYVEMESVFRTTYCATKTFYLSLSNEFKLKVQQNSWYFLVKPIIVETHDGLPHNK